MTSLWLFPAFVDAGSRFGDTAAACSATVRRRHGLCRYPLLQLEQKLSGGYEADLKRAALAHQRGVAVYWSRASA